MSNRRLLKVRYKTAAQALDLARKETNRRLLSSFYYKVRVKQIRMTEYQRYGVLSIKIQVGKYLVWMEYERFKRTFESYLQELKDLDDALTESLLAMLKTDIRVGCTCPDFKYRYQYWATDRNYLSHNFKKEGRFPTKTNPHGEGFACKHTLAVIRGASAILEAINDSLYDKMEKEVMRSKKLMSYLVEDDREELELE